MDNLQSMLVINAVIVWLIQAVKSSKYLPWFTAETARANRLLSAALAALASAGIVFTLVHVGPGHWSIEVVGLTAVNFGHFLAQSVANYATQKGLFKLFTLSNGVQTSAPR